jgi:hypothetical protein
MQPLELGRMAFPIRRDGFGLGIPIRERNLHHRILLDAVAVQVNGFEDALGEVHLLWCGQRRAVFVLERKGNGLAVVLKVGHKTFTLLRMCAIEP